MSLAERRVVVVGAGGLGCPIAWSLAEAGVGRITVLDPDAIESSNLPRQVLYRMEDVGRPKVEVMRERLAAWVHLDARPVRLDETNEGEVLPGADLLIDATDGARTKDWLNALAVRRRVPLVHAGVIRSEGRLLEIPPGGRPCLACLFGRLETEGQVCADLGVWNGAVGTTGFLAAAAALRRLETPTGKRDGYVVLDLEAGRGYALRTSTDPACPVCAAPAEGAVAALPRPSCPPHPGGGDSVGLDLRDESCPMNLLRARRTVEDLEPGQKTRVRLGVEGRESVLDGLRALGHHVDITRDDPNERVLVVTRGVGPRRPDEALPPDLLRRFARQVVLPGVGEAGQRRLLRQAVDVRGDGPEAETARLYLAAAGVGSEVELGAVEGGDALRLDLPPVAEAHSGGVALAARRARACLAADAVCREIVFGAGPPGSIPVGPDGRVSP